MKKKVILCVFLAFTLLVKGQIVLETLDAPNTISKSGDYFGCFEGYIDGTRIETNIGWFRLETNYSLSNNLGIPFCSLILESGITDEQFKQYPLVEHNSCYEKNSSYQHFLWDCDGLRIGSNGPLGEIKWAIYH